MVFGLFSKEKSLQRTIDRATNKLAQQADRFPALERLLEDGSHDALLGLCRRFAVTSTKSVEDEQEKNWVVEGLVAKGAAALAPLRRFVKTADGLSFPLRVLEQIADRDTALEIVDEILAGEPPGYVRHPGRRIDLVRWLSEWKAASSQDIATRLTPYLSDFDENVRFAVIDGLALHDVAAVGPAMLEAAVRPDEESGRIRRRLLDVLVEKAVPLGAHKAAIAAQLIGPLATFVVDGDVLKRR
jgi:hypothetical protein